MIAESVLVSYSILAVLVLPGSDILLHQNVKLFITNNYIIR